MNNVMSFGIHKIWKKYIINLIEHNNNKLVILDIASGTGDISYNIVKNINYEKLLICDININMLITGRNKLLNNGFFKNIFYIQANAENLPLKNLSIDYIIISFGLRNIVNRKRFFRECLRVLKKGGKLLILEFYYPTSSSYFSCFYKKYLNNIIPYIGKIFTNSKKNYLYLSQSIKNFPSKNHIKDEILKEGFSYCDYINLSKNIVTIHKCIK